MRTYDPDIEDQLDAGRIDRRDGVLLLFDEGAFGFFSGGPGRLTWNGVDYVGSGSLLGIKTSETDLAQTQNSIELTLSSQYMVDDQVVELFSKDLLQGIEAFSYYRRPAIIGRFYVSDAGQLIDFVQTARCEIDTILHEEDDTSGYQLRGILNTLGAFRKLVDGKTRNKAFQALIDPTDRGLDLIGKVTTEKVYWGAQPPAAGTA